MREIEGTYEELTYRPNYEGTNTEDYLHITLTDEEDIPDAIGKLRLIYPNLMSLDYNNSRTRSAGVLSDPAEADRKSPLVLFEEFYKEQNGRFMSDEQKDFAREIKSDRIKLMILFGSVARGDYRPDSDIDILVVSDYHSEIWPEISEIIASTVFEKEELLSVHVMPEKIFNETKEHSFLTNVLKEGIILEGN